MDESEQVGSTGGEFFLEATYEGVLNEVVIRASEGAIQELILLLQELRSASASGAHYHIDRAFGLIGNLEGIVLEKVTG